MKTALGFMAFMIRFPAAKLEELLERFEALPAEEKAKVKEAFKEKEE